MSRLDSNVNNLLTEDIIKLLFDKKICTIIDFLEAETKYIVNVTKLSYKDVVDVKDNIITKFSAKIETGLVLYEKLEKEDHILPTHIKSLDELLNGGFSFGNIYEICGYSATGKTQICLTVALNISQYQEKPVLYIDTKRDFSAKRLQNILESRKCTEEQTAKILNRILVNEISSKYELVNILHGLKNNLQLINDLKIIIIDSLPAIYYNTADQNNNLIHMNYFVNIMKKIAFENNLCFLITNVLLQNQGLNPVDCFEKPGLGKFWKSVPNTRLVVSKNDDDDFVVRVGKSTDLPFNASCTVKISDNGVC